MKQINIVFDDKDYEKIIQEKRKTGLNWRKFILMLLELLKRGKGFKKEK